MDCIKEGDFVFINGGGCKRVVEVKPELKVRLGRSGAALTDSLVGLPYGCVVHLDHGKKHFVLTSEYPDLDLTEVGGNPSQEEEKDNRDLIDDNQSQQLTNDEVAAIRREQGLGQLLQTLVEKSASYQTKTGFSQEKYLKKKQKKYGTLFKIERVTIDNLAETHLPTINPSDDTPDDARCLRLRVDAVGLLLHYGNIHASSRVIMYDKTNGVLPAYVLTRMGEEGRIFSIMDKSGQPNTFTASKVFQLPAVKERWKAIPRNPGFLEGIEEAKGNEEQETAKESTRQSTGISQWIKGLEARQELLAHPADALIIADDDAPENAVAELLPFLVDGGCIVVYSPFLEDLTSLFLRLRNDCVNISISETWYRHHQVLPQRTHPTVNMSTSGGHLLTAVKVQRNPAPRPRFAGLVSFSDNSKRPRDDSDSTKNETDTPAAQSGRTE